MNNKLNLPFYIQRIKELYFLIRTITNKRNFFDSLDKTSCPQMKKKQLNCYLCLI